MLDPHFHLLGEVERKHAEKMMVEEFRRGSEVKFVVSEKKPAHYKYRFWDVIRLSFFRPHFMAFNLN